MLHIPAITRACMPSLGQDYFRRNATEARPTSKLVAVLKRRLSDVLYRHPVDDLAASAREDNWGVLSLQRD